MAHLSKTNIFFSILTAIALSGCGNSGPSNNVLQFGMPVLTEQNISRNGCFNVQALQEIFTTRSSRYPALEITTDFKPDPDLNQTKSDFHTHAAFDVRETTTPNIFILKQPVQTDCTTVLAHTASGESLKFKIVNSTPTSVSLKLLKPDDGAQLSNYRREGLSKKMQTLGYEIQIVDNLHLRVAMTYKSFDAHCRSRSQVISTIQKDYYWAGQPDALPGQVAISEHFYRTYLSTLKAEPISEPGLTPQPVPESPEEPTTPVTPENPATPETPENPMTPVLPPPGAEVSPSDVSSGYIYVSVSELKALMSRDLRETLKKCIF